MKRTRLVLLLAIQVGLALESPTDAIVGCKLKPEQMSTRSMVILIGKALAIGDEELNPCPRLSDLPSSGAPLYFKCGTVKRVTVRTARRIRGIVPDEFTVYIPSKFLALACDDAFTLKPGQRLGLFLEADAGRYWSLSGEDSIQLLDSVSDDVFVRAAAPVPAK